MASKEHLNILGQGAEKWNEWRRKNSNVIPDLRKAVLHDANLFDANLSEANLIDANLSSAYLMRADLSFSNLNNANLTGAKLCVANLSMTNLIGADLSSADLTGANLIVADLSSADLTGANLSMANLNGANLISANLKGSTLNYTVLGGINLQTAQNLDLCQHKGPSIIDQMTLIKSGKLPEVFLKGCGLSDEFIQYIPFWNPESSQFYSCFISYSTNDNDFAKRLHKDLQNKGVRCWFAPEDMKIGDKIRTTIDESIRIYDKLILVLSENSINSLWVEKEVETAFEKENRNPRNQTVLFPIRLDETIMKTDTSWAADIRRTRHIGNFTNWKDHDEYKKAFERLMRDLKEA